MTLKWEGEEEERGKTHSAGIAGKVWLDMVNTGWRQIVHRLYTIKKKHGTGGWGKASTSLSYVVFEKDVFVRWVQCLALYRREQEFLSRFRRRLRRGVGGRLTKKKKKTMQTVLGKKHSEHAYICKHWFDGGVPACKRDGTGGCSGH